MSKRPSRVAWNDPTAIRAMDVLASGESPSGTLKQPRKMPRRKPWQQDDAPGMTRGQVITPKMVPKPRKRKEEHERGN